MSLTKEGRAYKKALEKLCGQVEQSVSALDAIMKGPSTYSRGKNLAKIRNFLDMANDSALYFGLHWGWKKIANFKRKHVYTGKKT